MSTTPADSLLEAEASFASPPFSTSLDPRLLRALADLKFAHPTLVQAKAIPLLLAGKDVLARARTGSGKTGAYAIPAVQKVLEAKEAVGLTSDQYQTTRAVILVPTRELALQVHGFIKSLTLYCEEGITSINAASGGSSVSRSLRSEAPDVIISTPTKLIALLESKTINLANLCFLVVDEADLLMSYGHKEDLTRLMDPSNGWMPKLGVQGCLMSATLSEEVEGVKGLVLRNPAILTLSEPTATSLLSQYFTHTSERDKFLYIYVLLKLKLIRGKSIVFVNDVERGYRVKLFLEQFGIKCCVVNSELPLSSRYHVVEEFNRGVYDVVVASDEGLGGQPEEEPSEHPAEDEEEDEDEEEEEKAVDIAEGDVDLDQVEATTAAAGPSKRKSKTTPPQPQNKRKRRRGDASSSLARGIDFTSASTVINFDLPQSTTSYFHRVGRTARAGHSGLALSFVVPAKEWGKDKTTMLKSAKSDPEVFARIEQRVKDDGAEIKEWDFGGRGKEIDGFRYRMEDALRSVTTKRVSDARREEVRRELLNSEKLKSHFAANPLDLSFLRHDAPLHPARIQPHLKHVPNYLMPKIGGIPRPQAGGDVGDNANISFRGRGGRGGRGRGGARGRGGGRGGKKVDPLRFKKA